MKTVTLKLPPEIDALEAVSVSGGPGSAVLREALRKNWPGKVKTNCL
jgi:hypothetical protein